METSAEIRKDIEELRNLRLISSRPNVQRWLDEKLSECEIKVHQQSEARNKECGDQPPTKKPIPTSVDVNSAPLPTVKITNYAWDQSDKFVKLYLTMPGVQSAPTDHVSVNYTKNSVELSTRDVGGKNYSLTIKGLLNEIDPAGSSFKQKSDSLLIMMKKVKCGESWKYLTKAEQQSNEKKTPKFDEKADPQESLMSMMKQMYEEGDDEMKRTIRKAWHESQTKKNQMFDDL